ncbi:hypothetical protein RFI_22169 [Reticulomyxa filosa]|uniref:Exo-beta-D-glucosaminidase Ig-fold domain-containing protein n=1 Tax=Reticulomyxa filosa TaxID=46433 RepID=X6MMF8_RETFI|nr:hypothetical protein RFI_22169 [Reticulomyxa filosa]|eukprot:ETO15198.1 hypothetical protein RFI_22169 [Reticulomyxa filosa]
MSTKDWNTTGTVYLIELRLWSNNMLIDDNTYWLADTMDRLNWNASTWYQTPVLKYADFLDLSKLPTIQLVTNFTTLNATDQGFLTTTVTLYNPCSDCIAFMVYARIATSHSALITPVVWTDNFITLFPKQTKVINATFPSSSLQGYSPLVFIESYNDIAQILTGFELRKNVKTRKECQEFESMQENPKDTPNSQK